MIHLFPNGSVEVPRHWTGRRGWYFPGYRWSPGYSQQSELGESQPLTRRHWQDIARRDREQLKFHPNKAAAKEALHGRQARS